MTMGWKLWLQVIFLLDAPLSWYQILPSPTVLCCDVGIYVNLLYAISGKDGMLDISLLSENSLGGINHQGMPK